jgi:hypothetical protein
MTTAFVTTSSYDPTKVKARPGKLFLLPNVYSMATPPAGTGNQAILTTYLGNFYVAGDTQVSMVPLLTPWSLVDAKGGDLKIDMKDVTFDPASGPKMLVGQYPESCTFKIVLGDVSQSKFCDILSVTTGEVTTLAASTTQAPKTAALLGTALYKQAYMCLYQYPAYDVLGNPIPGQFNNLFLPRAKISAAIETKFEKAKPSELTVTINAEADWFLESPDSGQYAFAVLQETTAPHS